MSIIYHVNSTGVWIRGSRVHVRSIDDEVIQYNIHHVVFGSSSNLEDHRHMNRLKAQHGVRKSRTVTCTTVEEMFALVSSAPHVITDRYHPGVASMIVGTKLSITKYVLEATKVTIFVLLMMTFVETREFLICLLFIYNCHMSNLYVHFVTLSFSLVDGRTTWYDEV